MINRRDSSCIDNGDPDSRIIELRFDLLSRATMLGIAKLETAEHKGID